MVKENTLNKEIILYCDDFINSDIFDIKIAPTRTKVTEASWATIIEYDCGKFENYNTKTYKELFETIVADKDYKEAPYSTYNTGRIIKAFEPKSFLEPKCKKDITTFNIIADEFTREIKILILVDPKKFDEMK